MFRKIAFPALIGAVAVTVLSGPAAAQSFGVYVDSGYPAYEYYADVPYVDFAYDEEPQEAWLAREQWEGAQPAYDEESRLYWESDRSEPSADFHDDSDEER